jgi:23S rRNA pseudouridine1911/1915/1917 synthase
MPENAKHLFLEVNDQNSGVRLDKYLVLNNLRLSRSKIQSLIKEGHIKVRGCKITLPSFKVQQGDSIEIYIPDPKPISIEPVNIPLAIIHEDRHLLVLEKPAGLVVHPGAGKEDCTVVHSLLYYCQDLSITGGYRRPGIVHRLDKNTSGLMLVAKDDSAHQALTEQFKAREISKTYIAVVRGRMRDKAGRLDLAIGRHPVNRKKMAVRSEKGRSAITDWQVIEEFKGASLLSIKIHTGRTHQIRVHMSSLGHPLLGDSLYGGPTELRIKREILPIQRQMLHASSLCFTHPITGEKMQWESKPPPDMTHIIEILRSLNG